LIDRRTSLLALLPPGFGLAGCATVPPATRALREVRPPGLPAAFELHEVPFFPHTAYHCGPAALATVLGALGKSVDPDSIAADVVLPARRGSLQVEMLAAARRHDALAVALPADLAALLGEVAAGRPVLVLLNLGLAWFAAWHYAVLVGYDLERETVVLRSGTTRRDLFALRTFEHTWARAGSWSFVAVVPGDVPQSASERAATEASIAFERVAAPALAARAYRAALSRWPRNLLLAMGFGNASYAAGDFGAAAEAFAAAAALHDSAAAWNNLAEARLRLGQRDLARAAALRALARAEAAEPMWLPAARETLGRLE